MKNVTVSLDDETYRRARIKAAEANTSVSALVKRFLTDLAAGESRFEQLKRRERELRALVTDFDASDRISRDQLHERGV
jgi:plasmid stability protein